MLDSVQWFSHESCTKGLHLYRTFGDWGEQLGPARKAREDLLATEADLAAWRRCWPLRKANADKHADARTRRKELLVLARPFWTEVRAGHERRRGRPALREPLRVLLAREGIDIGANDLDWLVAKLNSEQEAEQGPGGQVASA